ncbi:MAG: MBL fold metallo-hydrolase [Clostridiales bacterium]|nr:MBL fold metallo-hydrolase [Clostridiales bacterium]
MSTSTVTKIRYGNTNTFLIRGSKGSILIDTDYAGTLPAFYKAIKELGIKVSDVNYVLATHYHPDHIGLVSELMDRGVKLLLMESQVNSVHYSDPIFAKEPLLNYKPIDEGKATILRFEDAHSFLESLGIIGNIGRTRSHSEDGIYVSLNDGTFILGDLEPREYLDAYQDNPMLKDDWNEILSQKPSRLLYAHANERFIRNPDTV